MNKTLITTIGVVAFALTTVQAQLVAPRVAAPPAADENVPWWKNIISFTQGVEAEKSLTLAVYPSYAPGLKLDTGQKAEWGFGAAAMYPIATSHMLVGGRVDYLADIFWAPSVTVTPNLDFQFLGKNATLFGIGGATIPLQGTTEDGQVGAVIGAGIYATIWQPSENVSVQVIGAYERWTPVLDQNIYHIAIAATIKF